MLPATTTTFPWWCQFDVRPYPAPLHLGPPWLAVVETTRRGIWMLESLLSEGGSVGPVVACKLHDRLRIPIAAEAVHSPLTMHLTLVTDLECAGEPYTLRRPCPGQFWMLPPYRVDDRALTDVTGLLDSLQRVRGSWNRTAAA